jgi:hypothetical protein
MARFSLKLGDIFSVTLENGLKRYFQYIGDDITQLNSEVVRVFKRSYALDEKPDCADVVADYVDFYAHVVCKIGVHFKVWTKEGNCRDIAREPIYFRQSDESGNLSMSISKNWSIWEMGQEMQYVGKLSKKYKNMDLGIVVNPYDIKDRMTMGEYNFVYPSYE